MVRLQDGRGRSELRKSCPIHHIIAARPEIPSPEQDSEDRHRIIEKHAWSKTSIYERFGGRFRSHATFGMG